MFLDSSSIGASILKLPKELWLLASRLRATADRPCGGLCQVIAEDEQTMTNDPNHQLFVQEDQVAATGVQHFGPNSLHVR